MELKPTEHQIQKGIMDYLKMRGIMAWRQNSLSAPILDKYNRRHYIHTGMRGLPDIVILLPRIVLFCEIKSEKGKLSPDQKEFFRKAKELGHLCEVVRSVDDVEKLLKYLII